MRSNCAVLRTHSGGIPVDLSCLPIVFPPATSERWKLLSRKRIFLTIPQSRESWGCRRKLPGISIETELTTERLLGPNRAMSRKKVQRNGDLKVYVTRLLFLKDLSRPFFGMLGHD